MPPPRFVLHLGMPKTGSTAVQDTLAARRIDLAERSVLYPLAGRRGTAHHRLAWAASLTRVPRSGELPLSDLLADLAAEIDQSGANTVVVSSEALFHTPAVELRPIIEFADTKGASTRAIVYVRSPWEYHEGWYRQRIKTSAYAASFEQHLRDAPTIDIAGRLRSIESVIGRDRVSVLPYQRDLLRDGDVVTDFLHTSSVGPLRAAEGHSNPSLGAAATRAKQRLNASGIPHDPKLATALASVAGDHGESLFSRAAWEDFQTAHDSALAELATRPGFPEDFGRRPPALFADDVPVGGSADDAVAAVLDGFAPPGGHGGSA